MRKTKTTNLQLVQLIRFLKKQGRSNNAKIWRDIAERLAKPRKNHTAVNISRLNRYTKTNEKIVVPGKVLGAGRIRHPITVAALQFSKNAEQKIRAAKGKPLSILRLVQKEPEGSNVKIIG